MMIVEQFPCILLMMAGAQGIFEKLGTFGLDGTRYVIDTQVHSGVMVFNFFGFLGDQYFLALASL